jgi:hypothetical protein
MLCLAHENTDRSLGVRPHINLYGVRCTNIVLANSAHLIGQSVLVYINADDLRCVRAFLADGTELGVFGAQGACACCRTT